jgi:hypothetical protein
MFRWMNGFILALELVTPLVSGVLVSMNYIVPLYLCIELQMHACVSLIWHKNCKLNLLQCLLTLVYPRLRSHAGTWQLQLQECVAPLSFACINLNRGIFRLMITTGICIKRINSKFVNHVKSLNKSESRWHWLHLQYTSPKPHPKLHISVQRSTLSVTCKLFPGTEFLCDIMFEIFYVFMRGKP